MAAATASEPLMQYTRVLALGDSITYGARSRHGGTYPAYLEECLAGERVPSVVVNAGVNGERSYDVVERAWQYLGADEWIRTVVCMMGTNDTKPAARTPPIDYLRAWQRLRHRCTVTGTRLVAVELPYLDPAWQPEYDVGSPGHVEALNAAMAAWAHEYDVERVGGIFLAFRDDPGMLADGVHPTNRGNRHLAQRVYEALESSRGARNV